MAARSSFLSVMVMNIKRTLLTTTALLTTTSLGTTAYAENLQHTQQLLSIKQCSQCDLTGAGLVLANLAGADLSGADLSRANLSGANLTGADLSGANLTGASLNGANLTGANLSGANLTSTDLRNALLVNAQLFGVSLSTAYVQGTVGIPQYAGTAEDFYAWGVVEAERGNFAAAIENYNQALIIKPDFAPAYLGRGVAYFRLRDVAKATEDANKAGELFTTQGNTEGYQTSQNVIQAIEVAQNPPKARRGGFSLGGALVSIGSLLFKLISPF
ncbi:pentapeptide repeat-containing protein [Microcoleus sp. FACHB-SPT15]|uniref:pentapeptide repeat-containing protein n=1 Tax=Microcoleus sp. FACHB-SPT15 TaxID=2692830 RepID=UPI001F54FCE6|nr:pentapeptide repeat-containing protein [Microcoleus sp. FACHB-SPT15]